MNSLRSIFRLSKPRRTAWACIFSGLLIAIIWWVSLGASIYIGGTKFGGGVYSGAAHVYVFTTEMLRGESGLGWTWPHWRAIWRPGIVSYPSVNIFQLPLYPLALILLALGALALYRSRHIPAHLCTTCRYDRRGLPPNSPCPECGTLSQPTNTQT